MCKSARIIVTLADNIEDEIVADQLRYSFKTHFDWIRPEGEAIQYSDNVSDSASRLFMSYTTMVDFKIVNISFPTVG